MGLLGRMRIVVMSIVAIGLLGVVFNEVGRQLISRLKTQDGPFSQIGTQIETLFPLILTFLLLAILVWLIVGGIQRERTVDRRPRQ